jgi:hypothetical protein
MIKRLICYGVANMPHWEKSSVTFVDDSIAPPAQRRRGAGGESSRWRRANCSAGLGWGMIGIGVRLDSRSLGRLQNCFTLQP